MQITHDIRRICQHSMQIRRDIRYACIIIMSLVQAVATSEARSHQQLVSRAGLSGQLEGWGGRVWGLRNYLNASLC